MFKENIKYSMTSREARQLPLTCHGQQAGLGSERPNRPELELYARSSWRNKGVGGFFSIVQQEEAMLEVGRSLS